MKILILGGYGIFGGRLAELLSDTAEPELLIAGRRLHEAEKFCANFEGDAQIRPLRADRNSVELALAEEQPDLVVDASGPFQIYGDNCYYVIEQCILHGIDYLDFADAAEFVFGVSQFDEPARDAGVSILSGVSSFPVLSAAVLRVLCKDMIVQDIEGGIAPSPHAVVGLNVMRAVSSYAGSPVKLIRNGEPTTAVGLAETRRFTISVPGHAPLRNTMFSLVDVPDLLVLPPEHPNLENIWMGAGPTPEFLHRMLNLLAVFRNKLRLPSLVPFAGLFYFVLNRMKFGEHRGGMYILAKGNSDGLPVTRSWHLIAEGDDGPYIPSLAIEALIRKTLSGIKPTPGARPATRALELSDFDQLFDRRQIFTGVRQEQDEPQTLYQEVLGSAFHELPEQVVAFHSATTAEVWRGKANVFRGKGLIPNLIAKIFGFPPTGDNVDVSVSLQISDQEETWTRDFGGNCFSSVQTLGKAKNQGLVVEKFGPVAFAMALVVKDNQLHLVLRGWEFFGVPMPKFLMPNGVGFEQQSDDKFEFNVEITAPLIGKFVAYKGWLQKSYRE